MRILFQPLLVPESCCFCRQFANFRTDLSDRKIGQQVPCCDNCLIRASPGDVPHRRDYDRREKIASVSDALRREENTTQVLINRGMPSDEAREMARVHHGPPERSQP